jgi:predicted neuraminidase
MQLYKEFIYESLPNNPTCHGSTIAQCSDGTLLGAWFAGSHENHPDTAILLGRKMPGTDHWQDIRPVAGANDEMPYGNAVLFVEPDTGAVSGERIWLFYIRSEGRHGSGWCLDCVSYVTTSVDHGATWSEPRLLRDQISFLVKNKPLRLRTHELAIPAYSDRERNSVLCVYNDLMDNWSFYGPVPAPSDVWGVIQPSLVAYPDGMLQMYFRSKGQIWRSHSLDDGRTWSQATPTELPNPNSGIDALVLPDGRLLLVYNPTVQGRSPLWLSISDDRGDHWERLVTLENQSGEYSYPAIILGNDGFIHLTYTHLRQRITHVWCKVC